MHNRDDSTVPESAALVPIATGTMLRRVLTIARHRYTQRTVLVASIALLTIVVVRSRDEIGDGLSTMGVRAVVVSCLAIVVATTFQGLAWRSALRMFGPDPGPAGAVGGFYSSLIGKYIPGSIWSAYLQVEAAAKLGVRRVSAGVASLATMAITVATGAGLGVVAMTTSGIDSPTGVVLPLVVGAVLAVGCSPPVLTRLLGIVARRTGSAESFRPTWAKVGATTGWTLLAWAAFGAHLHLLTTGFHGDVTYFEATVLFALSWTAGFLFIPAPAGAGVRDVVLIAFLARSFADPAPLVIAVVSRALLSVVDLMLGVMGLIHVRLGGHSRRVTPESTS